MPREARAILFDLDDTLYPQRRFILSGFAAVARYLDAHHQVDVTRAFRTLQRALKRGERGGELQICLKRHGLPHDLLPTLIEVMRAHRPSLRLPTPSRRVLQELRSGWRIAIVTNGIPSTQASKVDALGLTALVDTVVYAAEHGSGRGKPDPEPFQTALARLGVAPGRAVFVGDDERCDVAGAAGAGMRTLRVYRTRAGLMPVSAADAVIRSLVDVPASAARLIDPTWSRDVA